MNTYTAYQIIAEKKLIIEYYKGKVTENDLIALKEEISKEPNYNFSFNTVLDIRDADLLIDEKGLIKIVEYLNSKFKGTVGRCIAYITYSPNDVVKSMLFTNLTQANNKLKMCQATFSTIKAAVKWFEYDASYTNLIETTIKQLKATSK